MKQSKEITSWLKMLEKVIATMPDDIEVISSYTKFYVYPLGTMDKHMGSTLDGFWMNDDDLGVVSHHGRFIPYSEGT